MYGTRMIFSTPETLSYYISLVREQRRDQFLASLFLPPEAREALIAFYALDIELEHVHHVVTEEMIGHIRYAWWREAVEGLATAPRDQPVLQALAQIDVPAGLLLALVDAYSENFPELPAEASEFTHDIASSYIKSKFPEAEKRWEKAGRVIASHAAKYGKKYYSWLIIKLLFV
jgi:hypothetical protein